MAAFVRAMWHADVSMTSSRGQSADVSMAHADVSMAHADIRVDPANVHMVNRSIDQWSRGVHWLASRSH